MGGVEDLGQGALDFGVTPSGVLPAVVGGIPIATGRPVARVCLSLGLPHLNRPFDYLVPAAMDAEAKPGVRVTARFSGRAVSGFITERASASDHDGDWEVLSRVVGTEQVLTPAVLEVARRVAAAHVGSLDDVLRLAIPPRHATAERELPVDAPEAGAPQAPSGGPDPGPWARYTAGASFLRRLAAGESPAASWIASPAESSRWDWPFAIAHAAAATLASQRGVVIVVPDHRDVVRVDDALTEVLREGRHVRLTADQGPQARYTAWLRVLRGHVRCVVGTRSAAFAPVRDLGLVCWWSDGDPLLAEPHAPYPHARDVLRTRRDVEGAGLLVGGFTRTAHVQAWHEQGWIPQIAEDPGERRRRIAPVAPAGDATHENRHGPAAHARIPSLAWETAKKALEHGPVLVQVPRRGYVPALACAECRLPARCPDCHGPLSYPAPGAPPTCRWCAAQVRRYRCPNCDAFRLRATVIGAERTTEELGRAFPGTVVRFSAGGAIIDQVPAGPALIIATPGAEPVAEGGYAATVLLDAWATLGQATLEAGEEALSRWMQAAALTRPRAAGGRVVLAGVPESPALGPVEALVRWAPEWFAARELDDRRGLHVPPVVWLAKVTGEFGAVADALDDIRPRLTEVGARVFGPAPTDAAMPGGTTAPGAPGEATEPLLAARRPAVALVSAPPQSADSAAEALAFVRVTRAARRESMINVRVGAAELG